MRAHQGGKETDGERADERRWRQPHAGVVEREAQLVADAARERRPRVWCAACCCRGSQSRSRRRSSRPRATRASAIRRIAAAVVARPSARRAAATRERPNAADATASPHRRGERCRPLSDAAAGRVVPAIRGKPGTRNRADEMKPAACRAPPSRAGRGSPSPDNRRRRRPLRTAAVTANWLSRCCNSSDRSHWPSAPPTTRRRSPAGRRR